MTWEIVISVATGSTGLHFLHRALLNPTMPSVIVSRSTGRHGQVMIVLEDFPRHHDEELAKLTDASSN